MKTIPLTKGQYAIVDDSDYEFLSQFEWKALRNYTRKGFYAVRNTKDQAWVYMHREVLGNPDGFEVDHKNRNTLDNRQSNLRKATHAQNSYNRPKLSSNNSGYKGVSLCGCTGKWRATIIVNKRQISLGRHEDIYSASNAYIEAAKKYHGEFARWE